MRRPDDEITIPDADELAAAYEAAWDEWSSDADNRAWESASADGLDATERP